MDIYDRIINTLLEARIEDYLDRLDEAKHEQGTSDRVKTAIRNGRRREADMIAGLNAPGAYKRHVNPNPAVQPEGDMRKKRLRAHFANRGVKKNRGS